MINIPVFGELSFACEQENKAAKVIRIENAAAEYFEKYCTALEQDGFLQKEFYKKENRAFAAYEKEGTGVFINAFYKTDELQLVVEEDSAYFRYADNKGEPIVTPQVTQVMLTDYGLSYVIRLSDGRFVVIDGGSRVEAEAEALYNCLKQQAVSEIPVIAAWIMTHPHSDHFYCFFPFMERFGELVKIEKFLFNFPEGGDYTHFPDLQSVCSSFPGCLDGDVVQMFRNQLQQMGIPVYVPHTGQCYPVGDTVLQFFASMDDSIFCTKNINASSLMFATEIAGQNILWTGDGSFSDTRLPDRYGEELKADILQIPHHGFGCGTEEAQIRGYRLIAPRICFLPASHSEAYTTFTTYREGTNYLMTRQNVQEMITGKAQRTLTLPYEPSPSGAYEMQQLYLQGRDNAGARTWIFTDLQAACEEDYLFTLLNTTYLPAEISIDLYFEGKTVESHLRKTKSPRRGFARIHCAFVSADPEESFNLPQYLESKGISRDARFAVRFISNIPVVISHSRKTPAYQSNIV